MERRWQNWFEGGELRKASSRRGLGKDISKEDRVPKRLKRSQGFKARVNIKCKYRYISWKQSIL